MKKNLFLLLIFSVCLTSCDFNTTDNKSYFILKNNSKNFVYECYVNGDHITNVSPLTETAPIEYSVGKHKIEILQINNLKDQPTTKYLNTLTISEKNTTIIEFPLIAELKIKNNSDSKYSVKIDNGLYSYIIPSKASVSIPNIDFSIHKVDLVQQDGYMMWPTEKTEYIDVNNPTFEYSFNP